MKKNFIYVLIVLSMIFTYVSCKPSVPENPSSPENTEDTQPDEDSILGKTYKVDISTLSPWDNADSFDADTGKLQINSGYGAGIWLGMDVSNYNYLEIKYKEPTFYFEVSIEYENNSKTGIFCKKKSNVAYITLQSSTVNYISFAQSNFSVIIESLTFTEKKPEESKDTNPIVDETTGNINSSITALDLAKQMKVGWNLAGSLEADVCLGRENASAEPLDFIRSLGIETEECWGNKPYTTKEIINFPKNNGYSTIRIPVTWYNHIIDDNYTIDPEWMARVKEIVDWAIEAGYYVILNTHHEVAEYIISPLRKTNGYVINSNATDISESKNFLEAIWTQICKAFNGSYDEHLIFETLNEPRNVQHEHQWSASYWGNYCNECKANYKTLNEYNQLCLNTIRASGGNNANRFVMVPALATGDATPINDLFEMPQDSATDKLILTVHTYTMGCEPSDVKSSFSTDLQNEIADKYSQLNTKFVKNGIPVVVGETSANRLLIEKSERIKWITYFAQKTSSYGMPLIYWDIPEDAGYSLDQIDRKNLKFIEPDFVQAMLDNWNINEE